MAPASSLEEIVLQDAAQRRALDIIAVDGDEAVRLFLVSATGVPWAPCEGAVRVVKGLQGLGFHVLLLTGSQYGPMSKRLQAEMSIDQARLHIMRVPEADGLEVIRLAQEYCCPFVWNSESLGGDSVSWNLPRWRRAWAFDERPELRVKVRFNVAGRMVADVSSQLRKLREQRTADEKLSGGDFATESDPSPPLLHQPTSSETIFSAGIEGVIVQVQRGPVQEWLLCILCGDSSGEAFQAAATVLQALLGGGVTPSEDDDEDVELRAALDATGRNYADEHMLTIMVTEGPHAGLRAVGLGSSLKKRRRAAHLAMAVTVTMHIKDGDEPALISPLVEAARQSMRTLGSASASVG